MRPFFAFGWGTVASRTAPRGRDPSRRRPAVILERSEESRGGLLEDDNYRAEWGSHLTCENFVGEHSICSRKNGRIWNPPLRSRRRACESRREAELPLCRSFQNYSSTASGPPVSLRLGHARVLTSHRDVIHCAHAASLPHKGRL